MAITKNKRRPGESARIFILAGEPSGDLIGADLMHRLKAAGNVSFSGVGGAAMQREGFSPHFDMGELSVMGFADVARQLPRLLARVKSTALHILEVRPDVVVLVDYQEFSTLLAKRLRKAGYAGAIILCVAPSVWAWRPGRAPKLNGVFDEILALFPFEPEVMERLGGPKTSYIGHPAVSRLPTVMSPPERGAMMLLPGSRRGEIARHMKLFRKVAHAMRGNAHVERFVLPTVPAVAEMVGAEVRDWDVDVDVLVDRQAQEDAYAATTVALASSGTVTLELALRGVPFVGTYVPDALLAISYLIAGSPRVLLPNVIAGKVIVPEELYGPFMASRVVTALTQLVDDRQVRQRQIEALAKVRQAMLHGATGAKKEDAADRILSYVH